jgi:hypothetical protein
VRRPPPLRPRPRPPQPPGRSVTSASYRCLVPQCAAPATPAPGPAQHVGTQRLLPTTHLPPVQPHLTDRPPGTRSSSEPLRGPYLHLHPTRSSQSRAASRLHRFYVPQPLGPASQPQTLEALLAELLGPTAAAAGTSRPAPPPTAPPGPHTSSPTASAASLTRGTQHDEPAASAFAHPATVVLEGEEARHASRALRLKSGDAVELCDGRGNVARGVVSGTDKQRVWVRPGIRIHCCRAVPSVLSYRAYEGRARWLSL